MPDLAGYAFVGFVAALVTTLTTPIVRRVALHFGWVVPPDDRRVHAQPTPSIGGVAMFLGLGAAMGAAWQMDRFSTLFNGNSEPFGVLLAAAVIFGVGLVDDLRPISAPAKVTGIVVAGAILAWFGVTMFYFRVPFSDVYSIGADWVPLITVDLAAADGQRGEPHRRPGRPGRGHRRHRLGHVLPRTASSSTTPDGSSHRTSAHCWP